MAILALENGQTVTELSEIQRELEPLNISLDRWTVGENSEVRKLLAKAQLNDQEKAQILGGLDHYFEKLKAESNYQDRDLISLHGELPGLDDMLAKFDRCHTHDDDEVRYIVDGEGIFGFVRPDGSQVRLTVQAEEYINVPKNTEHWFLLTDKKSIKAIRYFSNTEGWTPRYTDTAKREMN